MMIAGKFGKLLREFLYQKLSNSMDLKILGGNSKKFRIREFEVFFGGSWGLGLVTKSG